MQPTPVVPVPDAAPMRPWHDGRVHRMLLNLERVVDSPGTLRMCAPTPAVGTHSTAA